MFDLEQQISAWRQQMIAAGIGTPAPLEELEAHLREDVGQRIASGMPAQTALETTLREMGSAETLKSEFTKVRETISERLKRLACRFAGNPNYQLATNMNMNVSNQNLEPGWATYLKTAAFIVPALFFWTGFLVFVMPKLKQICDVAGVTFWKPLTFALNLSEFCKSHLIPVLIVGVAALVLLEWRSPHWPGWRRRVFGIFAYSVNIFVLVLITALAVLAVVAGSHLLPGK